MNDESGYKLPKKLPVHESREIIREYMSWPIYQMTPLDIVKASEIERKNTDTHFGTLWSLRLLKILTLKYCIAKICKMGSSWEI